MRRAVWETCRNSISCSEPAGKECVFVSPINHQKQRDDGRYGCWVRGDDHDRASPAHADV